MAYTSFELKKAFPTVNSCSELDKQIQMLTINKDYWARQANDAERNATDSLLSSKKKVFSTLKCDKTLIAEKNVMLDYYIDKYSQLDKSRIEKESISERNKRLYIGGGILVIGLGILIYLTKKM